MTVTYKPLRDDVLVQFIRPEKTSSGLVVVNATFGDAWPRCRVLDVGPEVAGAFKVDDVVLVDSSKGYAVNDGLACVPFGGIVCLVEGHSDDDLVEVTPTPEIADASGQPMNRKGRRVELARRH